MSSEKLVRVEKTSKADSLVGYYDDEKGTTVYQERRKRQKRENEIKLRRHTREVSQTGRPSPEGGLKRTAKMHHRNEQEETRINKAEM